jgi:hypothetical protein
MEVEVQFRYQRTYERNLDENPPVPPLTPDNNTDTYSYYNGFTLIFPIQSLQQAIKRDILSRGSIFHDADAISKSHPSGMSPSKTGNIISLSYGSFVRGMVGLTGIASSLVRYVSS